MTGFVRDARLDHPRLEIAPHDKWPQAASFVARALQAAAGRDGQPTTGCSCSATSSRADAGPASRRWSWPTTTDAAPLRCRPDCRLVASAPGVFVFYRPDGSAVSRRRAVCCACWRCCWPPRAPRWPRRPSQPPTPRRRAGAARDHHRQRQLPQRRGDLGGGRLDRPRQGSRSVRRRPRRSRSPISATPTAWPSAPRGDRPAARLPRPGPRLRPPRALRRRLHRPHLDAARRAARRAAGGPARAAAATAADASSPTAAAAATATAADAQAGPDRALLPGLTSQPRSSTGTLWPSCWAASYGSRPGPGGSGPVARSASPSDRSTSASVSATELRVPFDLGSACRCCPRRRRRSGRRRRLRRRRSSATPAGTPPIPQSGTRLDLGARAGLVLHHGRPATRLHELVGLHAEVFPRPYDVTLTPRGRSDTRPIVLVRRHAGPGGAAVMAPARAMGQTRGVGRVRARPAGRRPRAAGLQLAPQSREQHPLVGAPRDRRSQRMDAGGQGRDRRGRARHLAGDLDRRRAQRSLFGEADQRRRVDVRGRPSVARRTTTRSRPTTALGSTCRAPTRRPPTGRSSSSRSRRPTRVIGQLLDIDLRSLPDGDLILSVYDHRARLPARADARSGPAGADRSVVPGRDLLPQCARRHGRDRDLARRPAQLRPPPPVRHERPSTGRSAARPTGFRRRNRSSTSMTRRSAWRASRRPASSDDSGPRSV